MTSGYPAPTRRVPSRSCGSSSRTCLSPGRRRRGVPRCWASRTCACCACCSSCAPRPDRLVAVARRGRYPDRAPAVPAPRGTTAGRAGGMPRSLRRSGPRGGTRSSPPRWPASPGPVPRHHDGRRGRPGRAVQGNPLPVFPGKEALFIALHEKWDCGISDRVTAAIAALPVPAAGHPAGSCTPWPSGRRARPGGGRDLPGPHGGAGDGRP